MWVRMSTFQGSPDQSDEEAEQSLSAMKETVLPVVRQMDGYEGVVSLRDRRSGKGISLTFWESEEAMKASEDAANKLRRQAAEIERDEISGVERFEVLIYEAPRVELTE